MQDWPNNGFLTVPRLVQLDLALANKEESA
ncbi:MAG: hypothetical protein ACJAYB_003517 [Psychromonas sp.]|jgi:hypothetical protein